jgi:hypothetical protein
MAENILRWLPRLRRLNPKYLQDIAWAADCSERAVPLLGHQHAIDALLEAGRLYRGSYAADAYILQGPPSD